MERFQAVEKNLDSFIFFLKVSISKFYNRDKSTFSYVPH